MRIKPETWFALVFSLLFIALNTFLTLHYIPYLNAVPVILLVGLLLLFAPEKLFFALVLLAPASITLRRLVPGLDFDFWFPTEPILVLLLILVIIQSINRRYFQKELLYEPIFWVIVFFLSWILITVVPSELPFVSIKNFFVRFWFIGVFFYLGFILFRRGQHNINKFLWAYTIGLTYVAVLTLVKHVSRGLFNKQVAHQASAPYFIDHTSYGAALAFIIPVTVAFAFTAKTQRVRIISWILSGFLLAALVFSYSRAAWISLFIGGMVWGVVLLKIKFRTIAIGAILVGALFFTFSDDIVRMMESNTTDSSGDLKEHVKSIYNIRSDASNLERVNRWSAALDMYSERPMYGWGPNTYMFEYAPFQRNYLKTEISTNFGTLGNAHSEYLGLLSETGLIGAICFVLLYILVFYRGFSNLSKIKDRTQRAILVGCLIGLITYFFHGFLNNFLDSDKIAAPFWGFIAIILAIEYNNKELESKEESS